MTIKRSLMFASLLLLPLAVSACGVRDELGLGRVTPDEFAVVDRPPLVMPPDFNLQPPRPGAPRPQEKTMSERTEETVFGSTARGTSEESSAGIEQTLLQKTGAAKADGNIRDVIDREASEHITASKRIIDDILWWRRDKPSSAEVVDPLGETERLRANKQTGKPLNEGGTPIIERQRSGILGL